MTFSVGYYLGEAVIICHFKMFFLSVLRDHKIKLTFVSGHMASSSAVCNNRMDEGYHWARRLSQRNTVAGEVQEVTEFRK